MASLCDKPLVNLESAANHPCQALADWKTLDDLGVPRRGRFVLSWVNHPRALPLAVPAATVHMAAQRGMDVVVLRPEGYRAARRGDGAGAARGGGEAAARSPRPASATRRSPARTSCMPRSGARRLTTATPRPRLTLRRGLADWCVTEPWFRAAQQDCHLMHCLPVRRNVAVADHVLDGRRSRVVAGAANRMTVQMAVLHRMLATN